MTELKEAFEKIRSDKALARRAVNDPMGVLQELGVDTSNLKVREIPVDSPEAAGEIEEKGVSVCVSGGCGACVSVGGGP